MRLNAEVVCVRDSGVLAGAVDGVQSAWPAAFVHHLTRVIDIGNAQFTTRLRGDIVGVPLGVS